MFRVGQEVVCVDDTSKWSYPYVKKGEVYIIERIYGNDNYLDKYGPNHLVGQYVVDLVGIHKPNGFWATRFRPLEEKKTDISAFTKMLTPKLKKVRA